jgi:hypothetical protein
MGGLGGLIGLKADPNPQKSGESDADYATRRRDARFAVMKQEVDALLKKHQATEDLPAGAFSEARRGLRQRGFDQKEEDAIITTFAHTFGSRQGSLEAALEAPGGKEGETPYGQGAVPDLENRANPPLPRGAKPEQGPELPTDLEVMHRLADNYFKAGRDADFMTQRLKSGRQRIIPDPSVGTDI